MSPFNSTESLFQATRELIVSLHQNGHSSEAGILKDGFASLNGLTDGWALFLDAIREVEREAGAFADSEKKALAEIHDAAYHAVYRHERRAWWKFW